MTDALTISIERSDYTVGDTVRGQLQIERALPRCRALRVALEFEGAHIGAEGVAQKLLKEGPLEAGARVDFELTIPLTASFSFEGEAHSVRWSVLAEVERSRALNLKIRQSFAVSPLTVEGSAKALTTLIKRLPKDVTKQVGETSLLVQLLVIPLYVLLLPLAPIGLWVWARAQLLQLRVRDFEVVGPTRPLVLGEWVPVSVRFFLVRSVRVEALELELKGSEHWTTGSGKSRRSNEHSFHSDRRIGLSNALLGRLDSKGKQARSKEAEKARAQSVSRKAQRTSKSRSGRARGGAYRVVHGASLTGPYVEWRTHVQLPNDGLPSVGEHVRYTLTAELKLADWPDMRAETTIYAMGGRLAEELQPPTEVALGETVGTVAIVRTGEEPPAGMQDYQEAGPFMRWLGLSLVGGLVTSAALLAQVGSLANIIEPGWFGVLMSVALAGALAVGVGYWGMRAQLDR